MSIVQVIDARFSPKARTVSKLELNIVPKLFHYVQVALYIYIEKIRSSSTIST